MTKKEEAAIRAELDRALAIADELRSEQEAMGRDLRRVAHSLGVHEPPSLSVVKGGHK